MVVRIYATLRIGNTIPFYKGKFNRFFVQPEPEIAVTLKRLAARDRNLKFKT